MINAEPGDYTLTATHESATCTAFQGIQNEDGTVALAGEDYYWFFTYAIAVTAVLFLFVLKFYVPKTYIQDEAPAN